MSQFNPYQNPAATPVAPQENARQKVSGPAIALMIVAIISIVCCLLSLLMNVFLIASGAHDRMPNDGPIDPLTTSLIRMAWTIILIAAGGFVLFGAVKMKSLQGYSLSRTASIVAAIPCLRPSVCWASLSASGPS